MESADAVDFGSDLDFLRARISLAGHPKSDVVSDDDMQLLPEREARAIRAARARRLTRNHKRLKR